MRRHLIVIPESRMKAKVLEDRNKVTAELHQSRLIKSADRCSAALEAFWDNPNARMDSVSFVLREVARYPIQIVD